MKIRVIALVTVLLAIGCSDEKETAVAEGAVSLDIYGESFIEDGIPSDEMADGWSVLFDEFTVEATDIRVADVTAAGPFMMDISASSGGEGHNLTTINVPEGSHTGSAYTITSVMARGSATKDDVTKTFEWDLSSVTTVYTACETTTEVAEGSASSFQLTIHADHFFYDSLVSEEPSVVFQPLADADADMDGVITQSELESADIGSFDPGNAEVENLWDWLIAQTATLGHVDGEGHCDAELR